MVVHYIGKASIKEFYVTKLQSTMNFHEIEICIFMGFIGGHLPMAA